MENFYELNISNQKDFTFKCKGKFENEQDYKNKIYSQYDITNQLEIIYYFSESNLKVFKQNIINNLEIGKEINEDDPSFNNKNMYYGFVKNRIDPLGEYENKNEFEKDFYESEDVYEYYIFYLDFNKMNSTIDLIDKTIEIQNISNEDVLSYFNDTNNLNILDK